METKVATGELEVEKVLSGLTLQDIKDLSKAMLAEEQRQISEGNGNFSEGVMTLLEEVTTDADIAALSMIHQGVPPITAASMRNYYLINLGFLLGKKASK